MASMRHVRRSSSTILSSCVSVIAASIPVLPAVQDQSPLSTATAMSLCWNHVTKIRGTFIPRFNQNMLMIRYVSQCFHRSSLFDQFDITFHQFQLPPFMDQYIITREMAEQTLRRRRMHLRADYGVDFELAQKLVRCIGFYHRDSQDHSAHLPLAKRKKIL